MAYLANPQFGIVPGAPAGLSWWSGPGGTQFNMSGIMPQLPPAAPPAPPLAATPTLQDLTTRQAAASLTAGAGGAEPGGGGPGGGPGGLGPGAYPGQPNPGMGGGLGDPGGNLTFSGYPGVYSQSPAQINSQFGNVGNAAGLAMGAAGVPGGFALGPLGAAIDAGRYAGTLNAAGIPSTMNAWEAALQAALPGIPFTDISLGNLFGLQSARSQFEADRRNALANGVLEGNTARYPDMPDAYTAIDANAAHSPGAPFGNTGWAAGMDPTASQYPAGFDQFTGQATLAGLSPEVAGALSKEAAQIIGANQDIFGAGGAGTSDPGSKGDITLGGDVSQSSGVADGYKFRGGLIGAPPGRFAEGGTVDRRTRAEAEAAARQAALLALYGSTADERARVGFPNFTYPGQFTDPRSTAAAPGAYAAGGAVRAGGRMPTHRVDAWPEYGPRDFMSDEAQRDRGSVYTPEPAGEPSARERAILDFMGEMFRAREREVFPEQLARGGVVSPSAVDANITRAQFGLLRGIDPPGPDDQIGALQTGEGVITRKAMAKGWGGLLGPINAGKLDPAKVRGLLGAMPARRAR